MKTERIAAAPVLFGLGRDRIFLKELRFPEIAAHEEANLVALPDRQRADRIGRELCGRLRPFTKIGVGERQVMTVAARRDLVTMIQTLCQAAGLKLHAITPKLFGVAQAVERSRSGTEATPLKPNSLNAVLTVGQLGGVVLLRGRRLLQTPALANGPFLVSEISAIWRSFRRSTPSMSI